MMRSIKKNEYRIIPVFVLVIVIADCAFQRIPDLKDVFKNDFYIGTALNEYQVVISEEIF